MFERFDTWLIIGLVVVTIFCGLDAWITNLYRRIKERDGENRRLRHRVNELEQENAWLLARCESKSDHRVLIRDSRIDELETKVKTLEALLDQKWTDASEQSRKAAKKK